MCVVIPYSRAKVPPERQTKREVLTAFRASLVEQITTLIDLLDEVDGDPDMEPSADDEPSLGWTKTMAIGDGRDLEEGEVHP